MKKEKTTTPQEQKKKIISSNINGSALDHQIYKNW